MQKRNAKEKTKTIQFVFEPGEAETVSLVGEFNNWNPESDPMEKDGNGVWKKQKCFHMEKSNTSSGWTVNGLRIQIF